METFKVSGQLLQAVVDYLTERPFKEVFQLVSALQQETKNQPLSAPVPVEGKKPEENGDEKPEEKSAEKPADDVEYDVNLDEE